MAESNLFSALGSGFGVNGGFDVMGSAMWVGIITLGIILIGIAALVWFKKWWERKHPFKFYYQEVSKDASGKYQIVSPVYLMNFGYTDDNRTSMRTLKPFFNKKKYEPFPSESIGPGYCLYGYKLLPGGQYIPAKHHLIHDSEGTFSNLIDPVSNAGKMWTELEMQENAKDYDPRSFKDKLIQYAPYVIAAVAFVAILAIAGATIYFTGKYAMDKSAEVGAQSANACSSAVQGMADACKSVVDAQQATIEAQTLEIQRRVSPGATVVNASRG